MRQRITQQMQIFEGMTEDVSEADKEAVKAMESELMTFFDASQ